MGQPGAALPVSSVTPRLLTDKEAAAYLGRIPLTEVHRLGWGRVKLGIHTRYDVRALDATLDRLSGLTAESAEPEADNDAEAALDRFIAGA